VAKEESETFRDWYFENYWTCFIGLKGNKRHAFSQTR
jgi:hypothetical protein